jgi:hypothetical protein
MQNSTEVFLSTGSNELILTRLASPSDQGAVVILLDDGSGDFTCYPGIIPSFVKRSDPIIGVTDPYTLPLGTEWWCLLGSDSTANVTIVIPRK